MKEFKKYDKIRCGIAGVVGRGRIYINPILNCDFAEITAICDINRDGMAPYKEQIGENVSCFTDYREMVDSGLVDLVIIATPMQLHVAQSVYALERDINVVCEVSAACTLEECRKLYKAVKNSNAQYMMAENCIFYKEVMVIDEMIKRGYLGEVHYAESHYLHELSTPESIGKGYWRDTELYAANYSTHNLGPMLKWFGNERVDRICCIGSGRHQTSPDGAISLPREMSNVLLCKTESGRLMQTRVDLDTPAPYTLPYLVDGTLGRAKIERVSPTSDTFVHLNSPDYDRTRYAEEWKTLQYYERELLPASWVEAVDKIPNRGHARADYVMVIEILTALREGRTLPIDIDMAMNITLPGILSKESFDKNGEWLKVPKLDAE